MNINKKPTRQRILEAACTIFASKGFRNATVAEICEAADANIAAVNYHFGDKEKLYDEVWRHAFSITASAFPVDGGVTENSTPEAMVYAFASAILHRIFSETDAGLFPKLLCREMASPTLALEKIANEALFPQSRFVEKIVIKALGESATEQQIHLGKLSIIGQCAFYNFSKPLREHVIGQKTMTEEEIETTARHIARFSIGGLKEIQK